MPLVTRVGPALLGLVLAVAVALRALAAAAPSQDVPVPGGTAAFARALAIDPVPDRGRFMFEVTRLIYDNPESRNPRVAAFLFRLNPERRGRFPVDIPNAGRPDLVPVPLTEDVWSDAVFHRRVEREDLVAAILSDRFAALLCHGLAALDDQTLQFFAAHEGLLSRIVERSAPAFGAFSNSVRVRANRIVPPGDDGAVPLWEAIVGEKVTRPERFIQQLFEQNEGRLAYLYDTIGQIDAPRRAFALGLWMKDPAARLDRFKALATSGINAYREWHVRTLPFNRASHDAAMTLTRISVDETGAPAAPAARGFWSRVWSGNDLPDDPGRQLRGADEEPFDAAFVMEAVGSSDVRLRAERLDQIAFAQRVFSGTTADRGDVFVATRAVARYRMLALTLERIGITAAPAYVAAARHAARLAAVDGHRGFVAQAQYQGAVALVARMVQVRTITAARAQQLIERLAARPLNAEGRYAGGVAEWIIDDLAPALHAADTMEDTLVAALGGRPSGDDAAPTHVVWEGHRYRLDLGAAERRRLHDVREKQGGLPITVALDLAVAARRLSTEKLAAEDLESVRVRLTRLAAAAPERSRQDEEDNLPAGLGAPREAHGILQKAIDDLSRAVKAGDFRRVPRIADPLLTLTDELLAQALLSFAYAVAAGEPDGALLLADDVSHRHDFGFAAKDADTRARIVWSVPRQEVSPGVPWHVSGSLLGLDVALASSALRRVNNERVLEAPRLTSNERDGFAVSVSLMNPFALRDADRDALAAALDRGASRVAALAGADDVDVVADAVAMEGGRRRALRWTLAHERDRLPSMFSATERLVLGGGRPADFHAWGMGVLTTVGCLCSHMMPPGRSALLAGRPQLGLTASGLPDVNLQIAVRLKELNLPAALARVVLSAAMQDFIDEAHPTDDADWLALARRARMFSREQVEDYVAAATANGPLVPDNGPSRAGHR